MMKNAPKCLVLLADLYGSQAGAEVFARLDRMVEHYRDQIPPAKRVSIDQRDALLITYGNQVEEPDVLPLRSLAQFCARHLKKVVSGIHILPFYPYSSDDGFSVIDYKAVDSTLGTWKDIAALRAQFRLMFDAVINHTSIQSRWFQGFLASEPRYRDYFIRVPPGADVSTVVRPRALPLLTPFSMSGQVENIWTTFSTDQADLNYHNPEVLLEVFDVLLHYIKHGAELIRLDAIAFLWKEYGTRCLHLPQTHRVIQLIRAVLDEIAPHVALITETNVPHVENLSYFGDGANEAQLVYNFALPPLVLHTIRTSNARPLSGWASSLILPSRRVTFFNFLASHDGIGLNPARGILSDAEIDALVQQALDHDGFVSYKNNPDGTASPYELNINYFDALNDPHGRDPLRLQAARFMASQAIMLALVGVPGIYFHSLFGSRGWRQGAIQSGRHRTINRQKDNQLQLEAELADPQSLRHLVFRAYSHLLRTRASQSAFYPYGEMTVLDAGKQIFALLRQAENGESVLCLQNVSANPQIIGNGLAHYLDANLDNLVDLVSGRPVHASKGNLHLAPYQTFWLKRS